MNSLIKVLNLLDAFLWEYVCFVIITILGVTLTIRSRFYQFAVLRNPRKYIHSLLTSTRDQNGIHPLRLYFASVGGMVGLGNVVTITAVLTVGGPGGLLWLWLAFFSGMLVKYAEIYLGTYYREKYKDTYDGGPMYYLRHAFRDNILGKILPNFAALCLCVYGIEVLQFNILTNTFVEMLSLDRSLVIVLLLVAILAATLGGVRKLSNICAILMPPFLIVYVLFGIVIIGLNIKNLPYALMLIFESAFTGHAAVGGFVGSTFLMAIHKGFSCGVYSGDIAIGYDSIVQSETKVSHPEKQSVMAIFGIATELVICSITLLLILVTGVWTEGLSANKYVLTVLSMYLPPMFAHAYVLILFFIAGFTTIIGYFVVGQKCARYLSPKYGQRIYVCYGICMYIVFAMWCDIAIPGLIMSLCSAVLIIINLSGIYVLRKQIVFSRI